MTEENVTSIETVEKSLEQLKSIGNGMVVLAEIQERADENVLAVSVEMLLSWGLALGGFADEISDFLQEQKKPTTKTTTIRTSLAMWIMMHQKLLDTIKWLEQEINVWKTDKHEDEEPMVFKLTHLYNDLVETIRKVED